MFKRRFLVLSLLLAMTLFANSGFSKKPFKTAGVKNNNNKFINKIAKKFKLSPFETKVKYGKKKFTFKDYRNLNTKTIVFFNKHGQKTVGARINNIYIYSGSKKQLMSIANYFVNSTNTDKVRKKQWRRYLNSLVFNKKPGQFFEFAGVPQLRCLTHKIYRPKKKKVVYYLELTIMD